MPSFSDKSLAKLATGYVPVDVEIGEQALPALSH